MKKIWQETNSKVAIYKHKIGDFPVADKHAKSIISFPCDQHLSKKEMSYVIKCIKEFYSK